MPKSLSMLDPTPGIAPESLLYSVDLTLEPPERKVTAEVLAEFMQRYARTVEVLSDDEAVSYSTSDKSTVLVIISGTIPSVAVSGSPRVNSQFLFVNGTAAPVTITSASGFLGLPVTAVAEVVLQHRGDALLLTRAANPPGADVWIGVHLVGAEGLAALSTVEQSLSPDGDPEFIWTSSGSELTTRSITLAPGKWVLEAQVLFRAPTGGTYMAPAVYWADPGAPQVARGGGYWGGGTMITLGVPVPPRVITPATSTTYSLKASLDYAGGTGNPGAWVAITARRIE